MIDADLDRPWVPSGVREFRAGDKVRIRTSSECQTTFKIRHRGGTGGKDLITHNPQEYGRDGTIADSWLGLVPHYRDNHTILVVYDAPFAFEDADICAGIYAPSELELLEPAE